MNEQLALFDCAACKRCLSEPVSLQCGHLLCANCAQFNHGSSANTFHCQLCRCQSEAVNCHPRVTELITMLAANQSARGHCVCANCDQNSPLMYHCETCQQLLCSSCKSATHQAKVFLSHNIVLAQPSVVTLKHAGLKKCEVHQEKVVAYSFAAGQFACEQCLPSASPEGAFVTLEDACCRLKEQLSSNGQTLLGSQVNLKRQIASQDWAIEELVKMKRSEVEPVQAMFNYMLGRLTDARDKVLKKIERKYESAELQMRSNGARMRQTLVAVGLRQMLVDFVQALPGDEHFIPYADELNAFLTPHELLGCQVSTAKVSRGCTNATSEFLSLLDNFGLVQQRAMGPLLHGGQPLVAAGSRGSYSASGSSVTSGCHSSFGSSSSAQGGHAMEQIRRDVGNAFADKFANVHKELTDCRRRFACVVQEAQELQRDVTLRKRLTSSSKFFDIQQKGQRLKIVVGSHSTKLDELQPVFQRIWEEQLDRVKVQQQMYRDHVTALLDLRRDLQHLITASEQLAPFVDAIYQAILFIVTLEPNSQLRVSAIERQEHQRRADMERKRLESGALLAHAKRSLKSPADGVTKSGAGRSSASCRVVFDVLRDRSDQARAPSSSHCQRRHSKAGCSPSTRMNLLNESTCVDLESTFALCASGAVYPLVSSKTSVHCAAKFDISLENRHKKVSALFHELLWKRTVFRPLPVVGVRPSTIVSRPGVASVDGQRPSAAEPNCSAINVDAVHSKLPQDILYDVRPATLEAREKMLASLKSKIFRPASPD